MRAVLSGAGFVIRIGRREGACGHLQVSSPEANVSKMGGIGKTLFRLRTLRRRIWRSRGAGSDSLKTENGARRACPSSRSPSLREPPVPVCLSRLFGPLPILVFPARRVSTGWPGALYRKFRGLCRIFRKRSARSYDNKSGRFVSGRLSAGGTGSVGGPDARNYLTRNVRPMRRIVVDRMPFKRQMLFTVVP